MKMISSAKMHKAEQSLVKLLPFRNQIETIIGNLLSADAEFASPLLEDRPVEKMAVVVWGSDDGLCGAYNTNIYKELIARVQDYRKRYNTQLVIDVIPVGEKMYKAVVKGSERYNYNVVRPEGISSKTAGDDVKRFLKSLTADFSTGRYDKVDIMYMHFKSVSRQVLTLSQILPIVQGTFQAEDASSNRPYIFEPDASTIFVSVLPMYLLAVMQEVFTENRASEQAARVMAMQSANDNAKKLLEQLQLEYNKLRQQGITNELLDIVGGQVR